MIPHITLTTDRLTLRTPLEEDFAPVAAFMASPRARFVGGPVEDEFAQWRGFLSGFGHWALRGYGFFMVLHDGHKVGRVGVVNHIMWDEPELGWHIFDGFEGKGYATEAAACVRDWAATDRGLGPLISYIHPDNDASRRVAERLGARHERDRTLMEHPVQVWRHTGGPS
ncbi:anhydro-N-acetylmuramic acid kinase [Antarctobacter heliothermus]|uniref:Anhydro-N-acetylmuramic acid kinase n=1 Tax=Antarctobacter heliothermus TaxID=74033 RepID=A0A222E1Z2_9RHOB|nr:GNAT family N-acetyltransferase [Antarctobacter heliothermus]ASP20162.1 anhydro-N-acetylmuramic acid kinase [Antarctobacter heliothermus]